MSSTLRQVIEDARKEAEGKPSTLSSLTVLASKSDPYRLDTPGGQVLGRWFATQVRRSAPGAAVHLRGLHYRLAAAANVLKPDGHAYLNTDSDWIWLQESASAAGRWLGYVPFDRIIDNRNAAPLIFVPDEEVANAELAAGVEAVVPSLNDAMPGFALSGFAARQRYRIVFIGEKSSLSEVLLPIAQRIGAELLLPTGEASLTMIAELAARANADGRRCVILYLSDFDPSGRQMLVSTARKLQALRDLEYPDLVVELHQICLTYDQVVALDLPSTPLKETEKRADGWREHFGHEQTEIDALAALRPDVLQQIVEDAIKPFYDPSLEGRCAAAEQAWLDAANETLQQHPAWAAARDSIEQALQAADAAADALRAAQDTALALLADIAMMPPVEPPEAFLDTAPDEPLFDTDEDFAAATHKLIAFKALDAEPAS